MGAVQFARETAGQKLVLPIWHEISRDDLLAYSPGLADRLAVMSANESYEAIVERLREILSRPAATASDARMSLLPSISTGMATRIDDANSESLKEKSLLIVSGSRFELKPNQLTFRINTGEFFLEVPSALQRG